MPNLAAQEGWHPFTGVQPFLPSISFKLVHLFAPSCVLGTARGRTVRPLHKPTDQGGEPLLEGVEARFLAAGLGLRELVQGMFQSCAGSVGSQAPVRRLIGGCPSPLRHLCAITNFLQGRARDVSIASEQGLRAIRRFTMELAEFVQGARRGAAPSLHRRLHLGWQLQHGEVMRDRGQVPILLV